VVDDFPRPHPVQLNGSWIARKMLGLLGWRLEFEGLPARQGVLIVYPHTSNWDFFVLLLAKWAFGLSIKFWGKDSLFAVPVLGAWLRWLGGVPVQRDSAHGVVGDVVRTMGECQASDTAFWLALSPEGTRKWTPGWRSGFYQVALRAGVPLGTCCVNFRDKTVEVSRFYKLSGDVQTDMQRIAQAFQCAAGKHSVQAAPIQIIEK
jgi:1-acyl-sn-glycerol-3-phosphate acyltransferase